MRLLKSQSIGKGIARTAETGSSEDEEENAVGKQQKTDDNIALNEREGDQEDIFESSYQSPPLSAKAGTSTEASKIQAEESASTKVPPIESAIGMDDDEEMDTSPIPSSISEMLERDKLGEEEEEEGEEEMGTVKTKSQVKLTVHEHHQKNKSRKHVRGRIETSSLTIPTRRRRLSSSSSSSCLDSLTDDAGDPSALRMSHQPLDAGSTQSSRSRFNSKSWKAIINTDDKEKHDPNDSEWITFTSHVKNSHASAHEKLKNVLLEVARSDGTTKCTALLGKLIYRSTRDPENADSESKEFLETCATTIIRSILHLTTCHENKDAVVVEELVRMLFQELRHFSTVVLKSIEGVCMDYMKMEKDRNDCLPPRWIEIFGKIVSVLISKGDIMIENDIMEGKSYREYVISEICRLKWTMANSASFIAILREIPEIGDSELKLILCHVRSCVKTIKASGFPPIVYQMILLAGSRFPLELLSIASDYFLETENDNSNDTVTALEVKQKRNALGTVVYHFVETARHSNTLVKAVVKILKSSLFDFGKVMNPFILSVVLGLAEFEHVKSLIIDPLRNSIMKAFHSMHLSQVSYWYQMTAGPPVDTVTNCFKAILETRSSESELLISGLRQLGNGLLNAHAYQKQYPNTMGSCLKLGTYIITSLVKNNEDQLPVMMKYLLSSKSVVHVECLAACLEMRTRQVIHPSVIGSTCEIVRHLPMMDCDSAIILVKALAIAFQLSYILLDQLMLILRKTIWKSVESRTTAARTMIHLLSNAKVVGEIPSSQFSQSQRVNDDELVINPDQLPDNQPLCLEILSLTKRCFDQQSEIKKELYLGLHSVVEKNPGICELLCSQLYIHGKQFLSRVQGDDDREPRIDFKNVVEFPVNDIFNPVTIKEELGFMMQCLSHVVRNSYKAFASFGDAGPPEIVMTIENLVKQWAMAVLSLTPDDFENAAAEVGSSSGCSQPLSIVYYVETLFVFQTLQIIEALIEFLNFKQNRESVAVAQKLFEKYKLFQPLLQKKKQVRVTKKKGKVDQKESEDGGDEVNKTNEDQDVDGTESHASSSVGVTFKKPQAPTTRKLCYFHIFKLENVLSMLTKLYKSDSYNDFETILLDAVKQKLARFKKKEPLHEMMQQQTEKLVDTFADIASCIWNGLCNRSHDDSEDAFQVTVDVTVQERLETIKVITDHLCSSYESACIPMIQKFGDVVDKSLSYDEAFPKFLSSWKTLQGCLIPSNPDGQEDVQDMHTSLLFDILQSFSNPMSLDSRDSGSIQAKTVLNWIWTFMTSSSGKADQCADINLADSVVSCWLAYYIKANGFLEQPGQSQHDILSLSKTVRSQLGDNQFMESGLPVSHVKMWIVNEDTAATILVKIMDFVNVILCHILVLLGKLKSQQMDDENGDCEEAFSTSDATREHCFDMMTQILSVCSNLVCAKFPAGMVCRTMLTVIPQIFTVMTRFAEHLIDLSKTRADYSIIKGFVRPVNIIGKEFKKSVELMIQHIECVQRQQAKETVAKTIGKNKTAKVPHLVKTLLEKDRKLIPIMVYALEKFDQQIIKLSNKLIEHKGIKLVEGMKLTSARDFQINADILKEVLAKAQEPPTPHDEEERSFIIDDAAEPQPGPSRPQSRTRKRKRVESEDNQKDPQ